LGYRGPIRSVHSPVVLEKLHMCSFSIPVDLSTSARWPLAPLGAYIISQATGFSRYVAKPVLPLPSHYGNDWGSSCHGYTDKGMVERGIERELLLHRATGFPYISPISSGLRWRGERYIPKNVLVPGNL